MVTGEMAEYAVKNATPYKSKYQKTGEDKMKIGTCDFCDEDILHTETLLVDHKLNYHSECYLHLIKGFPKLIKEKQNVPILPLRTSCPPN